MKKIIGGLRKRLAVVRVAAVVALGGATILTACGPQVEEVTVEGRRSELYVRANELWQSSPVPICWENDNPNDPTQTAQRGWVASKIDQTWSFVSKFKFSGWGHCAPTSTGVRIRIESVSQGPHSVDYGRVVSGLSPGLSLDFTFANWSFTFPDGSNCRDAGMNEVCVRAIASHEVGHIMGFFHEQDRTDTPASCGVGSGDPDGVSFGAWDLNSVMNYCSPNRKSGDLSGIDVAGAQFYYGIGPRFVAATVVTAPSAL